jgi:CheY-like chemotaxis protein
VPTDLNVSVLALTGLLGSTLGRNIRIDTDLAPDLWPAMVDPNQMEAMILNLAINGRDAMEEGGVLTLQTGNFTLPTTQGPQGNAVPGDYVTLRVSDTGKGMRQDVMARVFEPFFTTKPLGHGSGLGLSQVHGLAVQSGGDVRIESCPDRGTTVTVLLPRARVLAGRAPGEVARPALALRPLRVLVADDDRAVREMTGEMLGERGHDAVLARDAAEALAILERARDRPGEAFDVLLADYVMPGMNGMTLIRAAQALWPGLRALLVTGNAEFHSAEAIRPEDIMRKPFTIAQLEERLGRVVDLPGPAREEQRSAG